MGKPQGTKPSLAGRRPYWTAEEDAQLMRLVKKYGTKNWGIIARELRSPIPRKGKSCSRPTHTVLSLDANLAACRNRVGVLKAAFEAWCRSRWMHQLNPLIKHEPFSVEEERILIAKQREYGNKWSKIATFLPGRTDNAIKNHWHGHVKRRITTREFSSDDDDVVDVELKEETGWNDADVYPIPWTKGNPPCTAQQDMECAMTLLGMSHAQMHAVNERNHHPPTFEKIHNENVYRVLWPPMIKNEIRCDMPSYGSDVCMDGTHPENSGSYLRPDQQKLLSQTLASAGLGHCSVLPLCPIKEEDIDRDRHVVIVLQNEKEKETEDSGSEGQSICVLSEEKVIQEWTHATEPFTVLESMGQSICGLPRLSEDRDLLSPRPRREIKRPTRFLEIQSKIDL